MRLLQEAMSACYWDKCSHEQPILRLKHGSRRARGGDTSMIGKTQGSASGVHGRAHRPSRWHR